MNRAPRYITILIAVILAVVGALMTIGGMGGDGDVGEWLLVAASALLILGVFIPGL